MRSAVSICLASAVLTACQTYEPAPLGDRPELLSDLAALTISPSDLPLPEDAAITIAGIELLHRIRKGQFKLGRLGVQGQTAPEVWNAVLGA